MQVWDKEFDVVVLGSGAGGMSAALVCASAGLQVGIFEKSPWFGGTTANSGGGVWVPCTSLARQAGIDDSPAQVRRFLESELGPRFRADLVDAFVQSGPQAIDFLAQNSEVKFQLGNIPDYHAETPGGRVDGRVLFPLPFDARQLGSAFAQLRSPWKRFLVFGGMMVGRRDIPALMRPFASWANATYTLSMLLRYAADRLTFHRGTQVLMGNALAARFLYSLRQRQVFMQAQASLTQLLVTDGGAVHGVLVHTPTGTLRVRARKGVVLATGGFAHSPTLRARYGGAHPHHLSAAYPESVGDGLKAAVQVGAAVDHEMSSPAFWTPASLLHERDGSQVVFPYGHLDRGKPGAIIVNALGQRFVNEADSYHDVVTAMYAGPDSDARLHSHLICDHRFIRQYGLGAVRPAPYRLRPYIQMGYLMKESTLAALARRIGVDEARLQATVEQHNRDARAGVDPVFGKGNSAFNRYNGDPHCQPNPCLRPLETGPFYALRIYPATLGTAAGIKTDANAQVINTEGAPIPGLYACGNDMASMMRGHYPAPGITLGPGIVFGYRAARHLVEATQAAPAL